MLCEADSNLTSWDHPPQAQKQVHEAEILAVKFCPVGDYVATSSADKTIRITSSLRIDEPSIILKGHSKAVTDIQWAHEGQSIFSCAADGIAALWDLQKQQRIQKLTDHESIINSCAVGVNLPNIASTVSDDCTVKIWDFRVNRAVATFTETYPILSVALDDIFYRIITGSLDGEIRVKDIRKHVVSPPASQNDKTPVTATSLNLQGHENGITGLALTDGKILASNSMDRTIRLWDLRPFTNREEQRCFAIVQGPTHNFEKLLHRVQWDSTGTKLAAGSADCRSYIFDMRGVDSGADKPKLLYELAGSTGPITEVSFHQTEPVIASGGMDKILIIRRIELPN